LILLGISNLCCPNWGENPDIAEFESHSDQGRIRKPSWVGAIPEFSMPGHRYACVTAFLFAGLAISPAFSSPLADLFNPAAKEDIAATTPATEDCMSQPGNSTTPGQHWVYHFDGHRKCWFQTAATVNKRAHHHVTKPVIVHEKNEAALPKRTVLDARAQMVSAAPVHARRSAPAEPKLADAEAGFGKDAAPLVPVTLTPAQRTTVRLTPDYASWHAVDVDAPLADSSLDQNTAASSVAAASPAPPIPDEDVNHLPRLLPRLGVVLLAFGFVLLGGCCWPTVSSIHRRN
jgi:hypothetical protein